MYKYVNAFIALFFCCFAPSGTIAQRSLALDCPIETAIKQSQPQWKLAEIFVRKNLEEDFVIFRWRFDPQEVSAQVSEHETSAKAAERLQFSVKMISMGSYSKLDTIGEESYLYEDVNSYRKELTKWRIIFRKGKGVITLEAPTLELAKRFSTSIADSLPGA
jgi:hypothetical protein